MSDVRIALSEHYSDKLLLLCGLAGDGTGELYKIVDFAARIVHEMRIDIGELRGRQLEAVEDGLSGAALPYGHTAPEQLLPYFLHPHEFVQLTTGEVVVSFKQAPYLRLLGDDGVRLWPPLGELGFSRMLSSTNCEVRPGVVGLAAVDSAARFERYRGGQSLMGCELLEYEPATGVERRAGTVEPFVRDTLHQLTRSPAGYRVGVDMSLEVDVAAIGFPSAVDEPFDVARYGQAPFPPSGFCVVDEKTGESTVHVPTTPCAAHAEIDPLDPAAFYVSCHHISKWQNNVIVHGPGAVEKYRWSAGVLTPLEQFSDADFLRVTSQAVFDRDGETRVAVTAFPNKLYLLDSDLNLVWKSTLFTEDVPRAPFACPKNSAAPLYLAISEDRRYAFLTSATELFVVDLDRGHLLDRTTFCPPGSFLATAHIELVERTPALARMCVGVDNEPVA